MHSPQDNLQRDLLKPALHLFLTLVVLTLLLLALPGFALAQNTQTGTIEQLDQDNGSVTISGRVLIFSESVTEVLLGDRRIASASIDPGMVVRYTLDQSGTVLRIELLGPIDMLSQLEQH